MDKKRIFIGSSSNAEAIEHMNDVAIMIEDLGHKPLRWNKPGVFTAGKYTLENLEHIAKNEADAAIFIFNADDELWYREGTVGSVRDNVLFEYGLFCGAVSREKTCICHINDPKLASDLKGITYINLASPERARSDIGKWLKSISDQQDDTGENQSKNYEHICNSYADYNKKLHVDADSGNNEARYTLGIYYFLGNISLAPEYERAYEYAKLAADEDYAPAQDLLARLYYRGCGVEDQNFEKSFSWAKKAADQDPPHPRSCVHIAFMYREGLGCTQNLEEAIKYYNRGMDAGIVEETNVALGSLYEEHFKDFQKAEQYYKEAAHSSAEACYRLGMLYWYGINGQEHDFTEAGKWLSEAASKGSTLAKRQMGLLYYHGKKPFPKDNLEASKWYKKAAEKGDVDSQYVLAYLYHHGFGVSQDDHKALMWYKKAAEQGHTFSQAHAGNIYFKQKKFKLAFEMFYLAASQGDAEAQRWLGDLYTTGLGCDVDHGKAIKYYQLAAKQGDVIAKKAIES